LEMSFSLNHFCPARGDALTLKDFETALAVHAEYVRTGYRGPFTEWAECCIQLGKRAEAA
jgi:hypothetical protein